MVKKKVILKVCACLRVRMINGISYGMEMMTVQDWGSSEDFKNPYDWHDYPDGIFKKTLPKSKLWPLLGWAQLCGLERCFYGISRVPSDHLKIEPVYLVVIKMFDFLDGRRRRQMINPHGDSLFSSSLRHSGGLLFIFVLKATKYCNQKIF